MDRINITETKAWSSIDIFLFSNGQQYSPPRKYHLTSEELQWWGTTLSYLGRTQYGSGQSSIELYTIDGTKIHEPLELINGAAYVAVKPPDSFINAGYEDYLLKATRSWEKRLAQKANDTETSKLENNNLKTEIFLDETFAEDNIMDATVREVMSNVADDIVLSSPAKIQPNKTQQIPLRKSITKQNHKKKSLVANNISPKKISGETDSVFAYPRKSSLKKSDDTNSKRSSISCSQNFIKRNVSQPQSVHPKKLSLDKLVKSQGNKNNDIQPVTSLAHRAKHLPYALLSCDEEINLKNEIGTDQSSNINKTITGGDGEQQVINLYKNKDIDLTSLTTDPDYDCMFDEEQDNQLKNNTLTQKVYIKEFEDVIKQENENKFQQINKTNDSDQKCSPQNDLKDEEEKSKYSHISVFKTYSKKMLSNEYTTSNNQADVAKNQITDEYIAYMNKGCLLLLKFHIKVKDCKTIFNRHKSDLEQTTSLMNTLKTEKTSQVNIDINFSGEVLNANKEDLAGKKSLELLLNKFYTENKCKVQNENPRFIILQCACRKHLNDENICCHEDSMLNENQNGTFSCCQCMNNMLESTSKDEHVHIDITPEKNEKIFPQSNGTRVRILAQKFEGSDKIISNYTNGNNLLNNNISRNEENLQAILVTRLNESSAIPNDNIQVTDENNDTTLNNRCDKATQTDWSNVLLEARRQEANTYTFHLPSLYLLKQCKL